ncbi:hypothetical protein RKD19_008052 [Streptomyces canus]
MTSVGDPWQPEEPSASMGLVIVRARTRVRTRPVHQPG